MGGGLKMLSKNACDRVHLIVKLLACSWKGALHFSEEGGSCFSDGEGGFIFKWGGIGFDGEGSKKIVDWARGCPPYAPPPPSPTIGKPVNGGLVFFSEIQK